MSWIREDKQSRLHQWMTRIMCSGPIPRHVAIIMDGNRRYAQKNNYAREEGHLHGFDKLAEMLKWCLDLGITEVTVYAFSIENFKRSKEEVDGLMELARQKFTRLMQEKDLIDQYGVCIRVLGNIKLLPEDIQRIIAEGVDSTKHNTKAVLNVCFSYTSRDEICHAMQDIAQGLDLQLIRESDISELLLEKCFYSKKSDPPDLLIRTSGEVRLSDFLLWQSGYSVLSFVNVLWPEFSRWHLYAGILHYQMNFSAVQKAREENEDRVKRLEKESDFESAEDSDVEQYQLNRTKRIAAFLEYIERRDDEFLHRLLHNVS